MSEHDQMQWFRERIVATRAHIDVLCPPVSGPNTDNSGLLPMLLEELNASLEELQVSGEEMSQQNDALLEMQNALAEERRRYQDLFDFAPDPYIITNKHGNIQEANRAAQEMLGLSDRRLRGKPLVVYVAAAARDGFRRFLETCQYAETAVSWETSLHPRTREPFPASLSVSASRDAAGNLVTLRWLVRDITERHHWEQMLRESNRELERRVRDRTQELEDVYARTRQVADALQTNLMQTIPEDIIPGFSTATLYRAASEEALIGGDFYDVFPFDSGKAALVVGDVSGKGLQAAAHIAEVKYALRAFLRETNSPGAALARLNDSLCEAQRQDEGGGIALVVLALTVLDPQTGEACYASAGAEPLLVLEPDGNAITEHGRGSGLVLGVAPHREYAETTLTIPPGALLLLATDGITEARRNGEMLGLGGLKRLLHETNSFGSVQEISREIIDHVCAFTGGALTDDVCLLAARRHRPSEASTADTDSRAAQITSSDAP